MIMLDNNFINLFYAMHFYCFKHEIGIAFFNLYKKEKMQFLREKNFYSLCYICNKKCKRFKTMTGREKRQEARTIDHIIPRSFCYKLGRYDLVVDRRNFAICCRKCNEERSRKILSVGDLREELGNEIIDKLISGTDITDDYRLIQE